MRGIVPKNSISAVAIALATLGFAVGGLTATPAHAAKAGKGGGYSKEFVAVAQPAQEEIKKLEDLKKAGADKAQLAAAANAALPKAEAAAAAATTPTDKLAAGQFLFGVGNSSDNAPLSKRGVQMMIDSGQIEAAKLPTYQFYLGNFAYASKDYPTAIKALKAAADGGFQDDALGALLVDSYAQGGQAREGLATFKQLVAARKAAAQPVPDSWFSRASMVAYNAKLGPDAMDVATLWVAQNPNKLNFLNAAQMVRTFGGLDSAGLLDVFRFMDRSGALDSEPKYVTSEYKEYVETADPRRFPGEVVRVIDKGYTSGALQRSDSWIAEARQNASGRVASDKASLAGGVAGAKAAGGSRALGLGDAFLSYGNAAQAEELFKAALSGSPDQNAALTRLGIAQFDQGKYAEAKASFEKVTGARQPLARLWLALIGTKG
jgi:tetratricopeptide (TPR) repeat protein